MLHDDLGDPGVFRNWNGLIVMLYGMAGFSFVVLFWREIRQFRGLFELLLLGFVFYGLHTGIDSSFSGSASKNVLEETAKLLAAACFTPAVMAALLAITARSRGEDSGSPPPRTK